MEKDLDVKSEKKPCEHLRNTDGKFWCNGSEIYWQDCCKYLKIKGT